MKKNNNFNSILIGIVGTIFLFGLLMISGGFNGMMGYSGYGMMGYFGISPFGVIMMTLVIIALVLFIIWIIKQIQEDKK
jgi:uncharacterized membrane protein